MQLFLSFLTTVAFELVSSGTVLSPKHKPRVFVHVYLPGSEYQNPLHQKELTVLNIVDNVSCDFLFRVT